MIPDFTQTAFVFQVNDLWVYDNFSDFYDDKTPTKE
jgi:hypothetical protein